LFDDSIEAPGQVLLGPADVTHRAAVVGRRQLHCAGRTAIHWLIFPLTCCAIRSRGRPVGLGRFRHHHRLCLDDRLLSRRRRRGGGRALASSFATSSHRIVIKLMDWITAALPIVARICGAASW